MRGARTEDLDGVVEAHGSAFPGYFLTILGPRFLRIFYGSFLEDDTGTLMVCEQTPAGIAGFIAGTSGPAEFFARLRRRSGLGLAIAALPAVPSHPWRIAKRFLAATKYAGERPAGLPGYWLLSSLGVRTDATGCGTGGALLEQFCDHARQADARGVYLVTDETENEAALRFYRRRKFVEHAAWMRRDGRRLLMLKRSFDG